MSDKSADTVPKEPTKTPSIAVTDQIKREVEDALILLDYAVGNGLKSDDGIALSPEMLTAINSTAVEVMGDGNANTEKRLSVEKLVNFDQSYHALASLTKPVTAETLRNTESVDGRFFSPSPAQRFTRIIWFAAIVFGLFAIVSEWAFLRFGPPIEGLALSPNEGPVDPAKPDGTLIYSNTAMQFVKVLVPYAYGGLGACAYLLRSAHHFIYERSFDLRRQPEYFNRILLGAISGGAIILFIDNVTNDDGVVIQLGASALGFLAGYSTDFLFNTIERTVGAILPKVGIDTIRRRRSAPVKPPLDVASGGLTLKELVDRFEKAEKEADRQLYQTLIEKLRDRL